MFIVNADDFGLAHNINKGIIEAIEKGAINSVSLVANGKALDEAINYLKSKKKIYTGIHFTLIEEKPLIAPEYISSLVTPGGVFHSDYRRFILKYIMGQINMHEVKKELEAQVKKLLDAGLALSHCDSHQHLHLLSRVGCVVLYLCKKYGINRIRIVNEDIQFAYKKQIIPLCVLKYLSWKIKNKAIKLNLMAVDKFYGFNTSMRIDRNIIEKAKKYAKHHDVELMTHPGFNEKHSGKYENWDMDWDRERNNIIMSLEGYFANN